MLRNGNFNKIARVFIVVFLCSEMHSSYQQQQQNTQNLFINDEFLNDTDETSLEYSKHQASIRLSVKDSSVFGEGHICGGALIAPSVVLTAARCIYNFQLKSKRHPSEFKVVLGTSNRYRHSKHTLVYGVTHVYYPNTYEIWALHDDIAVLLLERDVPAEHPMVQPISLLEPAIIDAFVDLQDGAAIFAQTSWSRSEVETQLLTANVTQLPLATCAKAYGQLFTNGMLCAKLTSSTSDECLRTTDIGAPLIYHNKLLGIATGLNGCTLKNYPALYTDVTFHTKWINAHIGDGTNQNSSIWGTLAFLIFTLFTLKTFRNGKC